MEENRKQSSRQKTASGTGSRPLNLDLTKIPETAAQKRELEKRTERAILDWLTTKLRRGFFWKNESVGIYDQASGSYRKSNNPYAINGTSDILGIWENGRFIAIEVKRPGNENGASDEQKAFIAQINRRGGLAFVATSVEKVEQEFRAAGLLDEGLCLDRANGK